MTAAQGQIKLADPNIPARAYEPPPQAAEMRACGREVNLVVNLEVLAGPVIGHRISQPEPTVPMVAGTGFKFHVNVVIVEFGAHRAGPVLAGANSAPSHHSVDVELERLFIRWPPTASSASVSAHCSSLRFSEIYWPNKCATLKSFAISELTFHGITQ